MGVFLMDLLKVIDGFLQDLLIPKLAIYGYSYLKTRWQWVRTNNIRSEFIRNPATYRTSHRRCSLRKGVLKNFTKFTGKHLCQSLFFNKVVGLRRSFFKVYSISFLMMSILIDFAVVVLYLWMFKIFGIIGIWKTEIFTFSGTERVNRIFR